MLLLPIATQGAPVAPVFDLDDLDGAIGFSYLGEAANDFSGVSHSGRGDVNGDGITDLLIGAYGADPSGLVRAGKTDAVFGGSSIGGGSAISLSALAGSDGFSLVGNEANQFTGWSVENAGDLNNDGIDDILIGSPAASPSGTIVAGKTYPFSDQDTALKALRGEGK